MLDWVPSAPYTAEQLLEVLRILRDPAGHHFADRKACAVLRHQAAAGRIGKARHWSEYCPVGQNDVSDFQRFHWCSSIVLNDQRENDFELPPLRSGNHSGILFL